MRSKVSLVLVSMIAALILFSGLPVLGQGGCGGGGRQGGQASMPEAPPIGFFGSYRVADERMDPSTLPIIGAWRINFDKSDPRMRAARRFKERDYCPTRSRDSVVREERESNAKTGEVTEPGLA